MNQNAIFSTAYFAPVQYMVKVALLPEITIEQHDFYLKQTFRNRCTILAANGPIDLTVPVIKGRIIKVPTKDIQVDYATKWQANHYRSIMSAYKSTPFYEYYIDDFMPIFETKFKYLIDLNNFILERAISALELTVDLNYTQEYSQTSAYDYREIIHPKKPFQTHDSTFNAIPYRQLFWDRFDFTPNLSFIDLLFNKGPESELLLSKMVK